MTAGDSDQEPVPDSVTQNLRATVDEIRAALDLLTGGEIDALAPDAETRAGWAALCRTGWRRPGPRSPSGWPSWRWGPRRVAAAGPRERPGPGPGAAAAAQRPPRGRAGLGVRTRRPTTGSTRCGRSRWSARWCCAPRSASTSTCASRTRSGTGRVGLHLQGDGIGRSGPTTARPSGRNEPTRPYAPASRRTYHWHAEPRGCLAGQRPRRRPRHRARAPTCTACSARSSSSRPAPPGVTRRPASCSPARIFADGPYVDVLLPGDRPDVPTTSTSTSTATAAQPPRVHRLPPRRARGAQRPAPGRRAHA